LLGSTSGPSSMLGNCASGLKMAVSGPHISCENFFFVCIKVLVVGRQDITIKSGPFVSILLDGQRPMNNVRTICLHALFMPVAHCFVHETWLSVCVVYMMGGTCCRYRHCFYASAPQAYSSMTAHMYVHPVRFRQCYIVLHGFHRCLHSLVFCMAFTGASASTGACTVQFSLLTTWATIGQVPVAGHICMYGGI
jgi:hypothetical protein